ncbi:MAG TPA: carbohydrate ABC transporter permease [Spirochaetia bacterium]|nr:carbohydrate ABC transporter permease [Spirochaetia bacterium]
MPARSLEKRAYLGNFLTRPVRYMVITIVLLAVLFPFYWLVTNALKTSVEYFAQPPVMFPTRMTLGNFKEIFTQYEALPGLKNSFLITFFTTLVTVSSGSLAAYALINGILPKKFKSVLAMWFLVQKMYPAVVISVPVFFVINSLHLMDTIWSLVIMNASFNLPLVILLMIGFYAEAPFEIEEQAMLDGCDLFQRYFLVTTPMVKAGIIATAILTFIASWNEFLFAVILTIMRAKPLTVIIAGFITDKGLLWGPMAAMGCVVVLPVLVLMWIVQKDFVSGVSAGALKA